MSDWFAVDHLDVDQLLMEWRWLCPNPMSLVARNVFGDLFLRDQDGQIHQLDVAIGKLLKVADSETQFKELATSKREEWFAESDEFAAAAKGLKPNLTQCIGFSVPLALRSRPSKPEQALCRGLVRSCRLPGRHQPADCKGTRGSAGATCDGKEARVTLRQGGPIVNEFY